MLPEETSSTDSAEGIEVNERTGPECGHDSKSVSFGDVEIRMYERIVGDNPAVSIGLPVTLAWEPHDTVVSSVDDFEENHPPRRKSQECLLPTWTRRDYLKNTSKKDLRKAKATVRRTQHQRKMTRTMTDWEPFEIVAESALRKFKRVLARTSTEKEQRKLWENPLLVLHKEENINEAASDDTVLTEEMKSS